MRSLVLATAALITTPALAAGPLPEGLPIAGPKSQVMNLGSVHLSEFKDWKPAMLEPLVGKLATFKPDVVTVENVDGEQCEQLRSFAHHADTAKQYCWDPADIRADTKLTTGQAIEKVRTTLAEWPASPSAAQRRNLAMLFLAAGERPSARVQWLRLSPAERRAGDGLTKAMIDLITRPGRPMNESFDVAAEVAARSGLDRVYQVDDHTSDAALANVGEGYGTALGKHFEAAAGNPVFAKYKADTAAIKDGATLLNYYRQANANGAMTPQIVADFGGAMGQETPQRYGRMYLGWWEVRNLRMVANIRASFAVKPGARVLNIVGASHKPWYDALMGTMPDVEVVNAAEVLR